MKPSGQEGTADSFSRLKHDVIDVELCLHCGTCAGLCPVHAIRMSRVETGCIPYLADDCISCGMCTTVCPGKGVSYRQINHYLFDRQPETHLGVYKNIFVGHAKGETMRYNGAGGGLVTSILVDLLDRKKIDGAAIVTAHPDKPWRSKSIIAKTKEEIMGAAQSRYIVHPHNRMLRHLLETEGRYAYVGLPCQIEALRTWQLHHSEQKCPLKVIIGIYCGGTLNFAALKTVLSRFGIRRLQDVRTIRYREGRWPGNFRVKTHDGRDFEMSKDAFNYLSFIHTTNRCWYCPNLTSEFADLSVGDAWSRRLMQTGKGWSVLIARTKRGQELMEGLSPKMVHTEAVTENEAIKMHSHGLNNKKIGTFIRIRSLQSHGKAYPVYGLTEKRPPAKRVAVEYLLLFLLWLCHFEGVQRLLNAIPIAAMEKMMARLKSVLKNRSRKDICREG